MKLAKLTPKAKERETHTHKLPEARWESLCQK